MSQWVSSGPNLNVNFKFTAILVTCTRGCFNGFKTVKVLQNLEDNFVQNMEEKIVY